MGWSRGAARHIRKPRVPHNLLVATARHLGMLLLLCCRLLFSLLLRTPPPTPPDLPSLLYMRHTVIGRVHARSLDPPVSCRCTSASSFRSPTRTTWTRATGEAYTMLCYAVLWYAMIRERAARPHPRPPAPAAPAHRHRPPPSPAPLLLLTRGCPPWLPSAAAPQPRDTLRPWRVRARASP